MRFLFPTDNRHHRSKTHNGFTLIELLVVITIIAILVALAIPGVTMALNKAKQLKCQANLHQIGIGMLAYASDNNGVFPPYWGTPDESGGVSWQQRLIPYMPEEANNDDSVWVSPAAPLRVAATGTGNWISTYSMHATLGRPEPVNPVDPPRVRVINVARQSDVILVGTGVQDPANNNLANVNFYAPGNVWWTSDTSNLDAVVDPAEVLGGLAYNHSGRCNCLMLDGSVRSFKEGEVKMRNVVIARD